MGHETFTAADAEPNKKSSYLGSGVFSSCFTNWVEKERSDGFAHKVRMNSGVSWSRVTQAQHQAPFSTLWAKLGQIRDACGVKPQANMIPSPTAAPVYLAAAAIHNLIQLLPAGTDYFIGTVLVVMLTGHLAQSKGSLARAVFPFVSHLRWGWHRAERALARGKFSVDECFDRAYHWSVQALAAEVVRLGQAQRAVQAVDTSTIARFRAEKRWEAAGTGYWGRAGKAVRANIVAAITSVVLIGGVRGGLVRRTRFGATCAAASAQLWQELPQCAASRLLIVDASLATKEQLA